MSHEQDDDLFTYIAANGNTYSICADSEYRYQFGGGTYRIDHVDVDQDTMNRFLEWLNNQ